MRRLTMIFAVFLCFAFVIGLLICGLSVGRQREYFRTEFHTDTGFILMENEEDIWRYGEEKGHVMLVLLRGKPSSTVMTGPLTYTSVTGWRERLSIEFPTMPNKGRIDLSQAKVRIGFESFYARCPWDIGENGVEGYLTIISQNANQIVAEYDIVVDARNRKWEDHPRKVHFHGRSTFTSQPCPEPQVSAVDGKLFVR